MEQNSSKPTSVLQIAIQCLIAVSLLAFAVETLPGLSAQQRRVLDWFEIFTMAIFTVEYFVRIAYAPDRFRFIFSFFGFVDLLAILPFYVGTGLDLRSLRAFRMLRLFRVLKLVRYSTAIRRFHRAFLLAKEEVILFSALTSILLFLAATGIYYCENAAQPDKFSSVFHSLWWAVCTLTTVGYGDIYPITTGGRMFTFLVLLIGLGIVAVPAGLVSSALSQARAMEESSASSSE